MRIKPGQVKRWGIDFGNVVIENGSCNSRDTLKDAKFLPGVVEGIKFLVDRVKAENVFIISKATPEQSELTKTLLEQHIYQQTGLLKENIRFCAGRLDKAPIIKDLKLEGHIDDRGEIIASLQDFLPCPVWFNPENADCYKWSCRIDYGIYLLNSWQELIEDESMV